MTPTAVLIAQLILQYGIPGAIMIIQLINKEKVEEIDLEALRAIKPPTSYLLVPYIPESIPK